MKLNILAELKKEFKKEGVSCKFDNVKDPNKLSVLKVSNVLNWAGYFKPRHYPFNLKKKILLNFKDKNQVKKVLERKGFKENPLARGKGYYYYDESLGLLYFPIEEYKDTRKKIHFNKGKIICFISPEGGGKSSLLSSTYMILDNYQFPRKVLHFGSLKPSRAYRVFDLSKKILLLWLNNLLGRITLTDRYIYLTFSENKILRKIIRILAPTPDIIFILKANYKTLKKRRGVLCPPKKRIDEIYATFEEIIHDNKITLNSERSIEKNLSIVIPAILSLYDDKQSLSTV
jgi:hypothetical protein